MAKQEIDGISANGLRRVYRLLCHLAWCDGEMHPKELEVLHAYARTYQIVPEEASILEAEGRAKKNLGVSKRDSEQELLVSYMIDVAMADGVLAAAEQKRLLKFGQTIGLSEGMLAGRIHQQIASRGKNLQPAPPEAQA